MATMRIHFLNVGKGDCTIIHFPARIRGVEHIPERIMMVDIYHHDEHNEYENVIDYYKKEFGNKPIFRFVCTHPHQDHICGLDKFFRDNNIEIVNFWDLDHSFTPENFDGHETHEDDWNKYLYVRDENKTTPKTIKALRGAKFKYAEDDRVEILSPSKGLIEYAHKNEDGKDRDIVLIDEMSYAIMIKFCGVKIILSGDGKEKCWEDIYENCKEKISDCDILKAGHHGHECAFHEEAIKLMNPKIVVFSNSEEEDGGNGERGNGAGGKYIDLLGKNIQLYKTCEDGTKVIECGFDGSIKVIK